MTNSVSPNDLTCGPAGDARRLLLGVFKSAVEAASPGNCLAGHWPALPAGHMAVLAIGKAAVAMADAAGRHYGHRIEGLVLIPEGHTGTATLPPGLQVLASSHPVPDDRSVRSAEAALQLAAGLAEEDLLLVLLSGGGSSVVCKPRRGVTLAEKQDLTRALHRSGATIAEINCVRSHLSSIKGGRLAQASAAPVVTLAISDVPGGQPGLIASGPTVPLQCTKADAMDVLARYSIRQSKGVRAALAAGPGEVIGPGDRSADHFDIVACGQTMLDAAAAELEKEGYRVLDLGDAVEGEARALAAEHAEIARSVARNGEKCCILSGGESTVTLQARSGRGGRNSEYLLALALALNGAPGTWALACDSDGIDGRGDHAGAIIAPDTLERALALKLDGHDYLDTHDSATFFERLGDLVDTGPTLTNVNDFRAILVHPGQ